MFLRKLTVMFVPLLMTAAVCFLLPYLSGLGFFSWVLTGLAMGVSLALLLPLSGASRRREPFAGLLWIPSILLVLTVAYQYAAGTGLWSAAVLSVLETNQSHVIMVECTFAAYMIATCIRTKR